MSEDREIPKNLQKPKLNDLYSCLSELNQTVQTYSKY